MERGRDGEEGEMVRREAEKKEGRVHPKPHRYVYVYICVLVLGVDYRINFYNREEIAGFLSWYQCHIFNYLKNICARMYHDHINFNQPEDKLSHF